MTQLQALISSPWYRQGWPWFLISLPAIAVVAGIATWYLAWESNDGLVSDDYYKQGLAINRSLESQQIAKQLGLSGFLSHAGNTLHLRLSAKREIVLPQKLVLTVLSPVRAGHDRTVTLIRVGEGYEGKIEALPAGHWNLALEDGVGTWKILAAAVFPLKGEVSLSP